MPLTLPSPAEAVRAAEAAARATAQAHLATARSLYAAGNWPAACFFAMTAIEELGRALLLQLADSNTQLPDERMLRAHGPKAFFGTIPALIFNDEARERHGTNAATGLPRIEAVRYVAEGGMWMNQRNACLYVECRPAARTVATPAEEITREHAYLMIAGAYEILARILAPAFTYHAVSVDDDFDDSAERAVLAELAAFMDRESSAVDLDRLNVVGDPATVARLKKAVRDARERERREVLRGKP